MKTVSGKVPTYSVYDNSGNLVAHGTSRELAEKFDVEQEAVTAAARNGTVFQWKYMVEKEAVETRQEVYERRELIKKLYNQGVNAKQMCKQTNIAYSTILKYIREMKAEGEIE